MDLSSEIYHALLPAFITLVLGLPATALGAIDGVAEATANFAKLASGRLSDRSFRRKPWIVAGYGLAALSKPLFPLATSGLAVMGARFADRIGKGIRGSPRDAMVADETPPEIRGRAFGLRQALDTVGAVIGPMLALAGMAYFAGNFQAVFWIAVVPAVLCVVLIVFGVEEPPRSNHETKPAWRFADARRLPRSFWVIVAIASVLTLARFSEAFLLLRAQDTPLGTEHAPVVMVVMALVYALSAYPAGAALDRGHGALLLVTGLAALVASDLVLARSATTLGVVAGSALWGVHMGLTQGLLASLVAAVAPEDLRGTAFGIFNLACGVALLVASVLAGWLWDTYGPAVTFYAGAAFTVIAGAALLARRSDVRIASAR